jgi:hypothetical protein
MAKKLVDKPRNAGTLTESAYFAKIRSTLRSGFRWWKPMAIALDMASRPYKGPNKRLKKEYQCKHCGKWYPRKEVEIDHIVECGSLKCYADLVPFIERLTVEDPNGYQILCKPCHKVKTNQAKTKKL